MPLVRRIPKRGFSPPAREMILVLNVEKLAVFEAGTTVDPDLMRKQGLLSRKGRVKILGKGNLSRPLTVRAHSFSKTAMKKIGDAKGKVEVI